MLHPTILVILQQFLGRTTGISHEHPNCLLYTNSLRELVHNYKTIGGLVTNTCAYDDPVMTIARLFLRNNQAKNGEYFSINTSLQQCMLNTCFQTAVHCLLVYIGQVDL